MPHQTSMPGVLDAADLLDDACRLLRTFCSFFVSFSDSSLGLSMPTNTRDDVGLDHELHQLVVLGEVERGLGEEHQRIAVAASARRSTSWSSSLIAFLLPMRLSSTMKTSVQLLRAQRFELGDDLRRGLQARPAAEHDDDVAELAGERAAARELHDCRRRSGCILSRSSRGGGTLVMSVLSACS